ncbi:MAG: tetratricopeptide repeat protein [Bacteroidia bacterium]|nr:tetratricopeptide repeat protein [Bacteroidia bacterium]
MTAIYRIIIVVFWLGLSIGQNAFSAPVEKLFDQGNQSFLKGDYKNAALNFEEILQEHHLKSPELYFNLGNCYFKMTDYPNAILNYERSLKLSSGDEDVLFNLNLANKKIEDQIVAIPELFDYRWFRGLYSMFDAGFWAVLTLILWSITVALGFVFVLGSTSTLKKAGFYGAIFSLLMSIGVFALSWASHRASYLQNEAIVFAGSVSVKSAPTETSTGLFLLHAGSKVKISDQIDTWVKIRTADGNEGWILLSDVEVI